IANTEGSIPPVPPPPPSLPPPPLPPPRTPLNSRVPERGVHGNEWPSPAPGTFAEPTRATASVATPANAGARPSDSSVTLPRRYGGRRGTLTSGRGCR
ncbi:hypothetical protein DBV15_04010, partial [Temnothorax longispinosus]